MILAAGNSARFKSNKLFAQIDGKSMIERAFDAIPKDKLCCVTVVTQYERIRELADKYGFGCVINDRPDLGLSHSVKLGTQALMDSCESARTSQRCSIVSLLTPTGSSACAAAAEGATPAYSRRFILMNYANSREIQAEGRSSRNTRMT